MTLTEKQLKEIEERSGKSGWDDIHGYEAVKLHQDHEALLEEVKRLQAKQAIWENCIHTNGTSTEQQKHEVARLQEALIEERAHWMAEHCGERSEEHTS